MASETLTDYERRRLENIRRNDEMMASLKIHLKAKDLSSGIKTKRKEIKGENRKPEKKPKTEFPAVVRRSLRFLQKLSKLPSHSDGQIRTQECLSMREAHVACTSSNDQMFIDTVMTVSDTTLLRFSPKKRGKEDGGCFNQGSLVLREENVACVVPGLISDVGVFPSEERAMIVVGTLRGFDQFMNLVIDNTVDINGNEKNDIGMVVIRGNSVVMIEALEPVSKTQ